MLLVTLISNQNILDDPPWRPHTLAGLPSVAAPLQGKNQLILVYDAPSLSCVAQVELLLDQLGVENGQEGHALNLCEGLANYDGLDFGQLLYQLLIRGQA